MTYLPDVNVWVALIYDEHVHHAAAVTWFESAIEHTAPPNALVFSRVTEMGLLRLLTNASVMGKDVRTPISAWATLHAFYQDTRIKFATEPDGLRDSWRNFSRVHQTGNNFWTDAYLAAFAEEAIFTLVSFDQGFKRYKGISLRLLAG